MIHPISISTNSIFYQIRQAKETGGNATAPSFELADYRTGQAILARNNISFRNLATPIEVTDKYNKKIEGKDHLDLPNIHIYEYPDTNLKVIVDKTNLIKKSQLNFSIMNTKAITNPLHDRLIYQLLKNAIEKISPEVVLTGDGGQLSYHTTLENDSIPHINYLLFNAHYNEEDLKKAKKDTISYFNSQEYKERNVNLKYLYPKEALYDAKHFEKALDAITLEDLKEYHKNSLKNSCATITAIMTDDDFHKNNYWKSFNSNINLKLKKDDEFTDMDINPTPNKILYIDKNKNIYPNIEMDYGFFIQDEKDGIITDMISDIILTSNMFKFKDYYVSTNGYYNDPLNLKNSKDLKHHCLYYKFEFFQKDIDAKELIKEFKENLQKLYASDLNLDINKWKDVYKNNFQYEYSTYEDGRRLSFLNKHKDSIFALYGIIDSITQDDVKKHLKKYLLEQEPVVHIKKDTQDTEGEEYANYANK